MVIRVLYNCHWCGVSDAAVSVPVEGGTPVAQWLAGVCAEAVRADHWQRSPNCKVQVIRDIRIPAGEVAAKIAGAGS